MRIGLRSYCLQLLPGRRQESSRDRPRVVLFTPHHERCGRSCNVKMSQVSSAVQHHDFLSFIITSARPPKQAEKKRTSCVTLLRHNGMWIILISNEMAKPCVYYAMTLQLR